MNTSSLEIRDIQAMLFESAAEALLVVNVHGEIQLINPRLEEMFGYSKLELIGKKVEMLMPEVFREKHVKHRNKYYEKPAKRPMGRGLDLYGQRKDGFRFPIEISLNHISTEGGIMIMGLISDVTERKKAEEKIRQYADIVENIQLGIFVLKLEKNDNPESLRIMAANPAAEELTSLKEESVTGLHISTVFPEAISQGLTNRFAQLAIHGGVTYDEVLYRTSSKTWSIKAFGLPDHCVGVSFEDISDRKHAEENLIELNRSLEDRVENRTKALNESQRLYSMISRNFPNGVINVLDKDFNYVFVEGMELYKRGIKSQMLVGTSFLNRIDKSIRQQVKERLQMALEGKNTTFELKSGRKIYLANAVGMHNADRVIDQVLLVSQNITNLKKAEDDIQQALAKERQLNELKSRFVAMASHEFRTPLTTIVNSISLLSKYPVEDKYKDKQQSHVSRITNSVQYLTNILNDFLAIDKLEEGKVEMHFSEMDICEFSKEMIESMENMLKKGQHLEYSHKGQSTITMDKQILKSIYNNLISNAIKYSPEKSLITISTITADHQYTLNVCDQGIGIPQEEQYHLFERFFRAHNALNIPGTGLGLNIVKKYVETLEGTMTVDSIENKGTSIQIVIPLSNIESQT